jgi:hypothetical protein
LNGTIAQWYISSNFLLQANGEPTLKNEVEIINGFEIFVGIRCDHVKAHMLVLSTAHDMQEPISV